MESENLGLDKCRQVITRSGAAAGKITGVNHIQIVVRSMDEAVRFYRDILGLELVRTRGSRAPVEAKYSTPVTKGYFFQFGNGELLSLIEVASASSAPSVYSRFQWPDAKEPPAEASKLDHLAFNVDDMETLYWFRDRLKAFGVPVTDVIVNNKAQSVEMFTNSIYFYDPSGTPLEIATLDLADPGWKTFDRRTWFMDGDPVASALAEAVEPSVPAKDDR